jgi:WD40 repeat protein/transcriptional regulator with XRE-family HTH domain/energy-coupling factor transporter ATP-binding protein EcfA2
LYNEASFTVHFIGVIWRNMSTQSFSPESFQTFGDLLKYLRRRERLTQLELSISVGYSEAQISRLEQNQRLPDLAALKALFIPALHLENEIELTNHFLQLAQSARQEDAPSAGIPPYKGLLFFDQADAELFFGREILTTHLADRVADLAVDASSRFLAVVGASGSGKSSLARAGLAVALQKMGWEIHIFTPTTNPLKTLAANYNSTRAKNGKHHLILVDQFEETFTLCHDENERSAFIERLLSIARDKLLNTTVVIALRADFYSHCAQYPLLREAVAAEQEYIGQMTKDELRRAIVEPAKQGGWEFESGLVELLLNDIGADGLGQPEPGALPLLSHALLATWERRRGRTFTLAGYQASGGVRGAIAETAESVFTDQLNHAQQNLARNIFLRLTELGEGTEDTRRRAALNELANQTNEAAQLRAVLNTLADARLITLNEDSAEVAHEALIREWERLHEWLTQDREGLHLHRHLTDSTHEWEARGHDAAELYRGARLAQMSEWALVNEERLNQSERGFIAAAIEQEQHIELERETQRQRELRVAQELAETQSRAAKQLRQRAIFLSGAFVLAIVLAGIAIFFGDQANQNAIKAQVNANAAQQNAESANTNAQQAQSEQRIATSRELAAAAISNLDDDPERSILLALQAESTTHTQEAENALHRSILASRTVLVVHHDAPIRGVAFSPDGMRFVTASDDHTAKVWDAKTGMLLLTLTGHTAGVFGVAYSPDGMRIATASTDHTAKVWDANTGQLLLTLIGHTGGIQRIVFNPDGTRLVTASVDKTAKVWDAITGKELLTFSGHGDYVYAVAFNLDGKQIATSGNDGNIIIWDAATGKELITLPANQSYDTLPRGVAFSPDGTRVAEVSDDSVSYIKIWDATTGQVLLSGNLGNSAPLRTIAFSPNGKLAVTGGDDQKAKVWDTTSGQVLYTLSGHTNRIYGAAFSPDGTRVVTASLDGTARIWDITPAKEMLFIPFVNVDTSAWSVFLTYSPDGTRILTDYTDSNARIWDAVSGKELLQLKGQTTTTSSSRPSYSYDGKLVAAGSDDNKINVWDAQTGNLQITLAGYKGFVYQTAFSPDGTRLASANSDDGTIMIWDILSGKALLTLKGSPNGVRAVAYAPDGKHLVTGDNDGNGMIWDATTGEKLFTLPNGDIIPDVDFSPNGKQVALASIKGIGLWDAITGKQLLILKGHTAWVNQVTFSHDGKFLASGSNDGTARIWDVATGVNILTLPVDIGGSGGVSFTPDGKQLAVGGSQGIYIFTLPIGDVIALAKYRVTRTLTLEECQEYLHMEVCPATP